ncbi:MAG: hypothetical protein WCW02_04460 [Candidatus Buchananbacteria bacterium]
MNKKINIVYKLRLLFSKPGFHLVFLMVWFLLLAIIANYSGVNSYQEFINTLANGKINFSIPGFHGVDFLSFPIYLASGSQITPNIVDAILAILAIPFFYLVGRELFKTKQAGIFLAYGYALMPLQWLDFLRGEHQASFIFFFIFGLWLLLIKSGWSWLALGCSYVIKPYAIFIFPIFVYKKQLRQFLLSLIIPVIYLTVQVGQTGSVMIGAHPDKTISSLFNIHRMIFNLVYAIQNIFSVHNFSPFSSVYLTDMSNVSVIIIISAIIGLFCYQDFFVSQYWFKELTISIIFSLLLGFVVPVTFEYLDMYRLVVFYIMINVLAIPVLVSNKFKFFVPLIVGLSGFQFLYSYMAYRHIFGTDGSLIFLGGWLVILIFSVFYYFFSDNTL